MYKDALLAATVLKRGLTMPPNFTTPTQPGRGALIVVEGVDRTGKTTQAKLLVQKLIDSGMPAEYHNFPDRSTPIGQLINQYLLSKTELSDEAVHLLFSANRWEKSKMLLDKLYSGVTTIVDRYAYSGVAFSAAKGLDIEWCKAPDVGLPRPDLVLFLTAPADSLSQRMGFGDERYEKTEFQKKVMNQFKALQENNWQVHQADRSIEELNKVLLKNVKDRIHTVRKNCAPLEKLWTHRAVNGNTKNINH